jgi:L-alanine-DL-glutamate epimerase-like enolase superfamily enzyme
VFFCPWPTPILGSLELLLHGEGPRDIHRLLVITLSEVSSRLRAPIATGENLSLFEGFEEIMASYALSIVTSDLQKLGGLAVAQSTTQFAEVHTMPVALHNLSSPAGVLLPARFCAAIPNCLEREFHGPTFRSGMAWSTGYQSQ